MICKSSIPVILILTITQTATLYKQKTHYIYTYKDAKVQIVITICMPKQVLQQHEHARLTETMKKSFILKWKNITIHGYIET